MATFRHPVSSGKCDCNPRHLRVEMRVDFLNTFTKMAVAGQLSLLLVGLPAAIEQGPPPGGLFVVWWDRDMDTQPIRPRGQQAERRRSAAKSIPPWPEKCAADTLMPAAIALRTCIPHACGINGRCIHRRGWVLCGRGTPIHIHARRDIGTADGAG